MTHGQVLVLLLAIAGAAVAVDIYVKTVRPRLARWRVQRQLPTLAAQAHLNIAHLGTWSSRYKRPKGL